MHPEILNIGDEIIVSPVGPGVITGFDRSGYPQVNKQAVGTCTRIDGAKYGPMELLRRPGDAGPAPSPVSPVSLSGSGAGLGVGGVAPVPEPVAAPVAPPIEPPAPTPAPPPVEAPAPAPIEPVAHSHEGETPVFEEVIIPPPAPEPTFENPAPRERQEISSSDVGSLDDVLGGSTTTDEN